MVHKTTFSEITNNTHPQWWRDAGLRKNVAHCMGASLCVYYLGYDSSLLNGLQALPQWNQYFDTPKGQLLGLYAASVYLPSFIFAFVGEQISNRWGRRVAIWVGTVILLVGGLWNAFATDAGQFIGSRVIIGSGGAIAKVSAPALLVEIAHPRLRPVLGGIYYGLFYSGSFMSAVMCIAGLYIPGTWSWRMPCFLQCIGPLLVLAFTITAPESPRFLIKKGRHEQALNVFAKYHANGQVDDPLVQWEYHEVQSAIQQEESVKASYLDFFRTPGNRRRLFVIISISVGTNWVGNSLISFYLAPILRSVGVADPVKIASINAGLAIWNLTIAVSAGTQVERFGRRPLFLTSFIGMFCSYAVVMGLSATFATQKNQAAGLAAVPFLFIFYGFYCIALNTLPYPYTAEILPFALRAKGLALFVCIQNVAISFNQFVTPIALEKIQWRYYAVFLVTLAFYVCLALFFYRETKGLSLEEAAMVYDFKRSEARAQIKELFREEDKPETKHIEDDDEGKDTELGLK